MPEPAGNFVARSFTIEDCPEVIDIIRYHLIHTYSKVYSKRAVDFYFQYHSPENIIKKSVDGRSLIVENRGKIIGTGNITNDYISTLFVHPDYCNNGTGKLIMRKLEELALLNHLTTVRLDAIPGKVEYFKKLGYRLIAKGMDELEGGEVLEYYKMDKILTPNL